MSSALLLLLLVVEGDEVGGVGVGRWGGVGWDGWGRADSGATMADPGWTGG